MQLKQPDENALLAYQAFSYMLLILTKGYKMLPDPYAQPIQIRAKLKVLKKDIL